MIPMNPDSTDFETLLRSATPRALRPELRERLEACARGTWTSLSTAESRLESSLSSSPPAALSAALESRLLGIVQDTPFPQESTIVPFPRRPHAVPARKARIPAWAAAAVAVAGGIAALLAPGFKADPSAPPSVRTATRPALSPQAASIQPVSFRSEITGLSDGVAWHPDGTAHRIWKAEFRDHMTAKDQEGRTIEVTNPHVQYLLVPAETE
jgi:hypothetical protein